ncbi:MAG: hydroxymethylbilane synthase [Planctomycetota bacterium]|jgi:hydroxymethylbilane synthase
MRPIKIASRASKLALAQAGIVKNSLENQLSGIEISIVKITTRGDRDRSDFLYKSESIGFFTSEVENAVLNGKADLAVHSLKDLPTASNPKLVIAAIPKRESIADALIASGQVTSIADLPTGSTIGTSSLRRIATLRHLRKDLDTVPLRGNVETRVSKVADGTIDAIIIACAGLNRLGLADKISAVLSPEEFLTAPGQGALAIQVRTEDNELIELVSKLDDKLTRIATQAERHILEAMHGGCSIPLGVYSHISGDSITIDAMISDIEAKKYIRFSQAGNIDQAKTCADKLAQKLLDAGGKQILLQIRSDGPAI